MLPGRTVVAGAAPIADGGPASKGQGQWLLLVSEPQGKSAADSGRGGRGTGVGSWPRGGTTRRGDSFPRASLGQVDVHPKTRDPSSTMKGPGGF